MVDTDRITGSAKELAGKAQGAIGDLVGADRDSVEGRARQAQGAAERVYGEGKDAVRDAADAAYRYAEDAYDGSGRYLTEGRRAVAQQVEESPLTALLIAGAVGLGIGLLINSRR